MDRLETRELAYFLAVADELHFGRAAARLGIAQPALSKTVRQLERRLGVTLFERTSRAVALTEAGRVLRREARLALEAVSAAMLRTQRAGTRDPCLILALKPGGDAGLLPAILAAYDREPGVLPVEVVFGAGPSRMLREGQADAALLYAPPDEVAGLDTETLLTEAPVAVLPASHPLAQRASLQMADLAGENLHRKPADPGAMKSLSELMHLIALGRTVAVLPRVLTRPLREDLITIPMADLPSVDLLLAWPAHSTSLSVAALARAAATAIRPGAAATSAITRIDPAAGSTSPAATPPGVEPSASPAIRSNQRPGKQARRPQAKPTKGGRQLPSQPSQDLSTLRPDSLPSRPGPPPTRSLN